MRSSVDLPQPDGPTSTTNSLSAIGTLTPWSTSTEPNALRTLRISTTAIARFLSRPGPGCCAPVAQLSFVAASIVPNCAKIKDNVPGMRAQQGMPAQLRRRLARARGKRQLWNVPSSTDDVRAALERRFELGAPQDCAT